MSEHTAANIMLHISSLHWRFSVLKSEKYKMKSARVVFESYTAITLQRLYFQDRLAMFLYFFYD